MKRANGECHVREFFLRPPCPHTRSIVVVSFGRIMVRIRRIQTNYYYNRILVCIYAGVPKPYLRDYVASTHFCLRYTLFRFHFKETGGIRRGEAHGKRVVFKRIVGREIFRISDGYVFYSLADGNIYRSVFVA